MKKLAVLIMTVLFTFIGSISQVQANGNKNADLSKKEVKSERKTLRKLEGKTVSDFAKNNFYKDFGDVQNLEWRRDTNFDVASFIQNKQKKEAFYDFDANLVGTTTVKTFADLPANAQKTIKTQYKSYKAGTIIFYDDNGLSDADMTLYGSAFENEDNYFVELKKGNDNLVVKVGPAGFVDFFKKL